MNFNIDSVRVDITISKFSKVIFRIDENEYATHISSFIMLELKLIW